MIRTNRSGRWARTRRFLNEDHVWQTKAMDARGFHARILELVSQMRRSIPSLPQADSIVDKLAAGDVVHAFPSVAALGLNDRHAIAPLDACSSVNHHVHLHSSRRTSGRDAPFTTGGQRPENQAAAH